VFDGAGKTVEISPYQLTPDEFVSAYCNNEHRQNLFKALIEFASELEHLGAIMEEFWVGGSFSDVNREDPGDLDVMLMVRFPERPKSRVEFQTRSIALESSQKIAAVKISKNIDITFLWLQGHPLKNARHIAHWTNLYSYNRQNPEERRPILIVKSIALSQ